MKYQNATAFRKHLQSSSPDHLCDLYLVGMGHDYERQFIMRRVFSFMQADQSLRAPISCKEVSFPELMGQVQSPGLFDGHIPLWIDHVEQLKKPQLQQLLSALDRRAILGAAKSVTLSDEAQKKGVTLELFSEKPWDRDQRILEELEYQILSQGKRIQRDVLKTLILRKDKDLSALEKEVEKLICFVGERIDILLDDLQKVVPITAMQSSWSMVEEVVWNNAQQNSQKSSFIDANFFYGWLSLMRGQLQLGYKIASLLEQGSSPEQVKSHFPKIWPKAFEQKKRVATQKGCSFFKKSLELLFEIEVMSKDNVSSYSALIDFFQSKVAAS